MRPNRPPNKSAWRRPNAVFVFDFPIPIQDLEAPGLSLIGGVWGCGCPQRKSLRLYLLAPDIKAMRSLHQSFRLSPDPGRVHSVVTRFVQKLGMENNVCCGN